MMKGRALFAEGLRKLGIEPVLVEGADDLLYFEYEIQNGPRTGEQVELGLQIPANFDLEPPHGPYYRPKILTGRGLDGVHQNRAFGPDWEHWSRPHSNWNSTDRSVRAYLRHLRTLNEELPPALADAA